MIFNAQLFSELIFCTSLIGRGNAGFIELPRGLIGVLESTLISLILKKSSCPQIAQD
jgi:hypothetical protein